MPAATAPTKEDEENKLKAALWLQLGRAVDDELVRRDANATPRFIGSLTELVWLQVSQAAKDMEAFARHANRSTVSTADVLLLTRRNDALEALLARFADRMRAGGSASAAAASATGAAAGAGAGAAAARRAARADAVEDDDDEDEDDDEDDDDDGEDDGRGGDGAARKARHGAAKRRSSASHAGSKRRGTGLG